MIFVECVRNADYKLKMNKSTNDHRNIYNRKYLSDTKIPCTVSYCYWLLF